MQQLMRLEVCLGWYHPFFEAADFERLAEDCWNQELMLCYQSMRRLLYRLKLSGPSRRFDTDGIRFTLVCNFMI